MSVIPSAVDAALAARHGPLVAVRTSGETAAFTRSAWVSAISSGVAAAPSAGFLRARRCTSMAKSGQWSSQSRHDVQSSARATTG